MSDLISVTVAGGKYTIRQTSNSEWECLRYGESWPAFEGKQPDNLHTALAYELDAKDAEIEKLKAALGRISRITAAASNSSDHARLHAALDELDKARSLARAALKGDAQ